jgi:hypothetical protein
MARQFYVAGCVDASFHALDLGVSKDGFKITIDPRFREIKSDCYGGSEGVYHEKQFMGALARISAEFVHYEKANVFPLMTFKSTTSGGATGVLPAIGDFVIQDGMAQTLILAGRLRTWSWPLAHVAAAVETEAGSKNATLMMVFEARMNNTTARLLFQEFATTT